MVTYAVDLLKKKRAALPVRYWVPDVTEEELSETIEVENGAPKGL